MIKPLKIIIDSREQTPWGWDRSDAITRIHSLDAGDYALECDCTQHATKQSYSVAFAIERKSLDDFLGTIGSGWDRFQRELLRMEIAQFPARVIIVEGNFQDVCFTEIDSSVKYPQHNHPQLRPAFVAKRIAELTMMGVSVLMCGDSQLAAGMALRLFRAREAQLCNRS